MLFAHSSKKEIFKNSSSIGYELAQLEEFAMVELHISKEIEPHEVPLKMSFYVIEGEGVCIIDGKETFIVQGDVLSVPPGSSRGFQSEQGMKLLAVRQSL